MEHLDPELAYRFASGRTDASAAAEIRRHLDDCETCRQMVADERALKAMLRLDDADQHGGVSPEALERVLSEVDAARPGAAARRRSTRRLWAAAGASALLAASTGVWSFWPRGGITERSAAALGISVRRQNAIVANLNGLAALRDDAWIADDFPTVVALQRRIDEARP